MKKPLKITLIATSVAAVLVLATAVFVSPIAKHYIEKHDHELVGRSIRMDKLRLNIFTGRLRVTGLEIGGAQDSATFFRLDSFDMRMRLWPLLARRIDVRHISFVGPDLKIYQRGSEFDFDDLIARFAADSTQAVAPEEPSEPWEIGIYDIAIRRGHIFYEDLMLGATWGLNDVNLLIPGVYFSGAKTDVGAVLNFAEGGSLATDVAYDIETSAFDIGLHLRELTLDGTLPYFRQSLEVTDVDGRLSADINLRGNAQHLLSLQADGEASLAGFALYDAQARPAIAADTLHVKLAEGDLGRQHFRFDRFYVAGFSALFELNGTGNNLLALLKPGTAQEPAASSPAAGTAAATTPSLQVADLEIARSSILLRDLTLEKPFEYSISDIRMRSRDFDPSKSNRLVVDARMQKTGAAKLRLEGALDDMNNQNITLWLTNVALQDFTPYCEHFTAYPLTQGNLTFRSQNIIRNRYLDGTNHLDMFEPKVDKKRKDLTPEMKIPLKLGLYVLKDKKGHVEMDLPVRGSLDSPEFSYRKIVLKAIGNVLLKVVTAPFSFLGGHRDNLEYIALDPQQYAFTSEQYASFDKIAEMVKDKPEMHIALTQRINLNRALPAQEASVLRLAYAEYLQTTDSASSQPRMSMLEYEKIQQTDIRTPQIMAFADSLLALRGISPAGLSPEKKAAALYRVKAAKQLLRMMAARDKALCDYMLSTHGVTAPVFTLRTLDSAALQAYTGRDRYTIALEVDGESVEIESPDSTATTPQAPLTSLSDDTPAAEHIVPATETAADASGTAAAASSFAAGMEPSAPEVNPVPAPNAVPNAVPDERTGVSNRQ